MKVEIVTSRSRAIILTPENPVEELQLKELGFAHGRNKANEATAQTQNKCFDIIVEYGTF